MSGATYRIDTEHQPDPHGSIYTQWIARIVRLSDDYQVTSVWAGSQESAEAKARAWLFEQNVKQSGGQIYVGDDGQDAEPELHSVKAEWTRERT